MRQRLGPRRRHHAPARPGLLDEPANGLDPAGIRELRELLRRLAGKGTPIFLSSHLLGEVERVCDRVAVIDRAGGLDRRLPAATGGTADRLRITIEATEIAAARYALAPLEVMRRGRRPVCSS